jgi:hypothetical protein
MARRPDGAQACAEVPPARMSQRLPTRDRRQSPTPVRAARAVAAGGGLHGAATMAIGRSYAWLLRFEVFRRECRWMPPT